MRLALTCWHRGTYDHRLFGPAAASLGFGPSLRNWRSRTTLNVSLVDGDEPDPKCYTLVTLRGPRADGKLYGSRQNSTSTRSGVDGV